MSIGVAQVSERLGVSARRVRALIAAGALPAEKIGTTYVLDERDVDAFAGLDRPDHARAMSPRVAWAAAALLDGIRPTWLRADELSRLRARLARMPSRPGTWRAQAARLATRRESFRAGAEQVAALLADGRTVRTGRSATNLVTDPLVGPVSASVWISRASSLSSLHQELGLLRSSNGNVTVAVPALPDLPVLSADGENAFRLIVATDLLAEDDPRSRAAGTALLETTTTEFAGRQG